MSKGVTNMRPHSAGAKEGIGLRLANKKWERAL